MEQIYDCNKQIGNAYDKNVVVINKSLRVPGKSEDAKGNDNAENLRQRMEKEETVTAGQV
jgi:hypothetical protein